MQNRVNNFITKEKLFVNGKLDGKMTMKESVLTK